MSLAASLSEFSGQVEETLETFLKNEKTQALAVDPVLRDSIETLTTFSLRGGKAIRPFMVKLAYELAGGEAHPGLVKAAASIELHHKHILILDDIADRDEERYGGPTVEWAYRNQFKQKKDAEHLSRTFAMLDGVWLGALARELLAQSGFGCDRLQQAQHILNTLMFRDILAGWQIHALECTEPIDTVSPAEFIRGLELVTARYTFEGPFKVGLTLAGSGDSRLTTALTRYSHKVGTAFQIHDDILGLFGDEAKTGKPVGNDIREGKKTLLVLIAYHRASESQQKILSQAVGNANLTKDGLGEIQAIVKTTGSLQYSRELAMKMVEEGVIALEPLKDSQSKQILTELARYIVTREK